MKKTVFYTEAAYVIGLFFLAYGTALTEWGGFGISMVVAPAYLLYRRLELLFPFFSFGMAEYALQALILLLLVLLMKKGKLSYLLSFAAAVLYGIFLDISMTFTASLPAGGVLLRGAVYLCGALICTAAISLLFRTYLPPEAYELFVKELARKFRKPIPFVKTLYDCGSLLVSVAVSFALFGKILGIGPGTVICALVNGSLIQLFTTIFDRLFLFRDRFALRHYFEEREESL